MKLIIDIPEQIYLNAKTDTLCGADILVSAIKNGIPCETVTEFADRCRECGREKVLDKIRAEIENDWQLKEYPSSPFSCGLRRAIEIIDKYKGKK